MNEDIDYAQKLYSAHRSFRFAEESFSDFLTDIGVQDWDEWHFDEYDGSITIHMDSVLTLEQQRKIIATGFRLIRTEKINRATYFPSK